MTVDIIVGDCLHALKKMPNQSVNCVVTSPPYWGLRDYGMAGQIGLEATFLSYIAELVSVFSEVRRVLRDDGTCWVNLGDAYAGSWGAQSRGSETPGSLEGGSMLSARQIEAHPKGQTGTGSSKRTPGLKPKDLLMLPARFAIAMQDEGWWLRKDIIWHKSNPMPESIVDRPTSSHEHVFLFAKSGKPTIWRARDTGEWGHVVDLSETVPDEFDPGKTVSRWRGFDYFYDADAIREAESVPDWDNGTRVFGGANKSGANNKHGERTTGRLATRRKRGVPARHEGLDTNHLSLDAAGRGKGRNARDVWTIATRPFPEAHFATFPPELPERCIKAGCPEGGLVLDPFFGAGTTGLVADRLGRNAIGIELNPSYAEMAAERIRKESPMFAEVSVEVAA